MPHNQLKDPRFPAISVTSKLGKQLIKANVVTRGRDGTIYIPTNKEILDAPAGITIEFSGSLKSPTAILKEIPPGTKPGTIIFIAHKDMGGGRASVTHYSFVYNGGPNYKRPKPKKTPPPPDTITDLFKGRNGKFNPPPHNVSRPISPTAYSKFKLNNSAMETISTTDLQKLQRANHRGYIIEDIDTALDADGKPKTKVSQLWGFEFMYNPENLSNSVSAAAYEVGNQEDTALSLTGTQKMSVNLLINRVVDIPALKLFWENKDELNSKYKGRDPDYPRAITMEDVEGIIKRGTAYDIDFLYRVLNGDPLLGPTSSVPISDFGYLMQVPVWVYFGRDFKYKVVITGVTITHYMFTESMVPIMTNLIIDMMRIPAPVYPEGAETTAEATNTAIKSRLTYTKDGEVIDRAPTYGIPSDTDTATTGGSGSGGRITIP